MTTPQVSEFFQDILADVDPSLSLQFLAESQADAPLTDADQAAVAAVIALLFDRYDQITIKDLEAAVTLTSVADAGDLLSEMYHRLHA